MALLSFFRRKPFFPRRKGSLPATCPVSLKSWFQDTGTVSSYREIVRSEAFLKAVATLSDLAAPSSRNTNGPSEEVARRAAWLAGYEDAFRDIQRMAEEPTAPIHANMDDWGYIDKPAI